MPIGVVKTKRDERLWSEAKSQASKQGHDKDYAYVMDIFKKMKGMNKNGALMTIAKQASLKTIFKAVGKKMQAAEAHRAATDKYLAGKGPSPYLKKKAEEKKRYGAK